MTTAADTLAFVVGDLYLLATGGPKDALSAQGFETGGSGAQTQMGITSGNDFFQHATAVTAWEGQQMAIWITDYPVDVYRIINVNEATHVVNVDRVFTYASGNHTALIFNGPPSGLANLVPDGFFVLGG